MAYDEDEDLEDSTTAAFWRKWDKEQADFEMPWEGWVEKYFPETVPLSVYAESNEPMFEDHQAEVGCYHLSTQPEVQYAFLRACQSADEVVPRDDPDRFILYSKAMKREIAKQRLLRRTHGHFSYGR